MIGAEVVYKAGESTVVVKVVMEKLMKKSFSNLMVVLTLAGGLAACTADPTPTPDGEETVDRPVDENGKPTFSATGDEEIVPSKDDAVQGERGLPVAVDGEPTQVWAVFNQWEDTDTPVARKAGIAWGENSGLNWDEKYQAWVDSMEKTETGGTYSRTTFVLTTPFGKSLPAPALECAETAIFLRIAFASWYNLPFFLEARDGEGRVYFGHFGMRRDDGKYGSMPNFKTRYSDYSNDAELVRNGQMQWPSDSELRAKKIPGSFDDQQPMVGPDAHAGAYFDEVFLNKRAGHFLVLTLAWFGSINLADPANTFNLRPDALKAGDVLVERWQERGIGHTLVVMRSDQVGETTINGTVMNTLEAEVASGSMPRRQPVWESSGASKRYFTLAETGGEGYETLGGGIKRWRTTKNINGRWTNVVMPAYTNAWVNSRDTEAIASRPDVFEQVLVELSPDQKRDVLLEVIESKRQHLRQFPASCSARINREKAFDSLYELMEDEFGMTTAQVDDQFRILEDYVFTELTYEQSKTCCWNRSTAAMHEIVMDMNLKLQEDATQCVAPVVFMNRDDAGDGYEMFRQHAEQLGRSGEWVAWSADESCPQAGVPEDTIAPSDVTGFCDLESGGNIGGEVDPPVSGGADVEVVFTGGVAIPDNDPAGAVVRGSTDAAGTIASASIDLQITHTWRGDLEISLVHPDGTSVIIRRPDSDDGDDVSGRFEVPGLAGKSAAGEYTLIVKDTQAQDTGRINSAALVLNVAE